MGWEGQDAARQAGWGAGAAREKDVSWTSVTQRLMSVLSQLGNLAPEYMI